MSELERGQSLITPHRKPMASTTINRKMLSGQNRKVVVRRVATSEQDAPQVAKSQQQVIENIQQKQQEEIMRPTAQQLKQQAIEKALASASKTSSTKQKKTHFHFGLKRTLLALCCSALAVFAIVYFVKLNAPDISLKVAAIQTGIDASYPTYTPRGYNISDITSESGKVTLNYKNEEGNAYSLTEEKSSWDSYALLNNFVKEEYGDNYTVVKEQGLAIYIDGSDAAWVNGGIFYNIKTTSGSLTKKQIVSIAVNCQNI